MKSGRTKSTLSICPPEGGVESERRGFMTKREEIEKKTEELVAPIIAANQFELVDVEYVKEAGTFYLRVYVDKERGITVDDCELVSRALSDKLDEKDFIADSYILEVSSPGLGRPLKKEKDFVRSIGKEVEVRLYKPLNHEKEYTGVLKSFDERQVTIETEGGELEIPKEQIALIRLAFTF
jgi:ribosome maturation factor RimP